MAIFDDFLKNANFANFTKKAKNTNISIKGFPDISLAGTA